ncbi:MAG: hypothetical protein AAF085_14250 [Planctomycetota bacterium]
MNSRLPALAFCFSAAVGVSISASAQIEALRNADDQYIQGLRDSEMAELLERFSEIDPPEDPIAKLALDVSLKEFVASDLLKRATAASQTQDFVEANRLFMESRGTYEGLLAAQRQLIADNPQDERLPIWQTDFAEMLINRYLGRYFQNVMWHYEFGAPSAEQTEVYEKTMIEALQVMMDASNRLSELPNRRGVDAELTAKLEEMQILYKLEDYTAINSPYWLAHAAHGITLLPDNHDYYTNGNLVRGQRPEAGAEKTRLRNRVVDECSGALENDERTKLTAKLLSGKTLVRSKNFDDIEDGVDLLDDVISGSPGTIQGYMATLAKAYGRWNGGELDIAEPILEGMGDHEYVKGDGTIVSRLLAADLHFRILDDEAAKAPANQRQAKVAEAYEKSYIPLIDGPDGRFKSVLFARWAAEVGDDVDPMMLPATVRMGIGEQLTNEGMGKAQFAIKTSMQPVPAIPTEEEQWRAALNGQVEDARTLLNRAIKFNDTLTAIDAEPGPLLARGLFNLGTCQYWLAEIEKALKDDKNIGWQPYFRVAKTWLSVAQRVPDSEQAEGALAFAINLLLPMDNALNKDNIKEPDVRLAYKEAFLLINERWPAGKEANNNRLYAGFHLFEKVGDLDMAAQVYNGLPNTHRDFYQSKRQMVYAMHRSYRGQSDKLRLMVATQPLSTPPDGLTPQQVEEYERKKLLWQQQHDTIKEDITRKRDAIVEEAEIVMIDAKNAAENERDNPKRFSAVTAMGACRVVLAGMDADAGDTDKAMDFIPALPG